METNKILNFCVKTFVLSCKIKEKNSCYLSQTFFYSFHMSNPLSFNHSLIEGLEIYLYPGFYSYYQNTNIRTSMKNKDQFKNILRYSVLKMKPLYTVQHRPEVELVTVAKIII